MGHIVDLLFSQSARCAVRKEEGCEKSLCLAMFGRWDSGAAPLGGEGRAERMEEREVRKEAEGGGRRREAKDPTLTQVSGVAPLGQFPINRPRRPLC